MDDHGTSEKGTLESNNESENLAIVKSEPVDVITEPVNVITEEFQDVKSEEEVEKTKPFQMSENDKRVLKQRIKEMLMEEMNNPSNESSEKDITAKNVAILNSIMKEIQEPTLIKKTIRLSPRKKSPKKSTSTSKSEKSEKPEEPKESSLPSENKTEETSQSNEKNKVKLVDMDTCTQAMLNFDKASLELEDEMDKMRKIKQEWLEAVYRYKPFSKRDLLKEKTRTEYDYIIEKCNELLTEKKHLFCWEGKRDNDLNLLQGFTDNIILIENTILDCDVMYNKILKQL